MMVALLTAYSPYETMPVMPNWPSAPHIGHRNHLCDMAERGQISLDQMKDLVKDAKYICKKCGRVAAKAENLCEPVSL
jgi:hypothetical protein